MSAGAARDEHRGAGAHPAGWRAAAAGGVERARGRPPLQRGPSARLPDAGAARQASIDVFRGLTIAVMVFVNQLAGVAGVPAWARHLPGDVDGMSFVDGVFPAFLFIVGLSLPFALRQRVQRGDDAAALVRHVLARTAGLMVLGLFMVNAEEGYAAQRMAWPVAAWALAAYVCAYAVWGVYAGARVHLWRLAGVGGLLLLFAAYRGSAGEGAGMTAQWWGILGLIGWAYGVAAAGCLAFGDRVSGQVGVVVACFALYALAHSSLGGAWAVAQPLLDQADALVHGAITACGVVTALLLFDRRQPARACVFALLLAAAGVALRPLYPVSKIHASPSWCCFSAAACVALAVALHALLDVGEGGQRRARALRWLAPVAAQPLVTYLLPYVVDALMTLAGIGWMPALRSGALGVAACVAWTAAMLALATGVTRRIRLQL